MTAVPGPLTDALAWLVVAAFCGGIALARAERPVASRRVAAGAWGLFALFWLLLVPHFALAQRSAVEGLLALAAVPACAAAGLSMLRESSPPVRLSWAVGIMGVLYLPAETIPLVRGWLIETVAAQAHWGIGLLGHDPVLEAGPEGYRNTIAFATADGPLKTRIVAACTGLGSMAIFGGLIAAVEAPLARKLRALALAVGVIWVLNLVRNVFIATAFGAQWFQQGPLVWLATAVVGYGDPRLTSYFVADRVIAQTLSVAALAVIAWLVVRVLPAALDPIEEAVAVLTGTDVDLAAWLGIDSLGATGR